MNGSMSPARGQSHRQVVVKEIHPGKAVCIEASTRHLVEIPLIPMRGRSGPPRVDEVWVVDRTLGYWTFSSIVHSVPPVVTGARSAADPVTLSLLAALVELGLVVDGTA